MKKLVVFAAFACLLGGLLISPRFSVRAASLIEQKQAEIKQLEQQIADKKQEITNREAQNFSYDNYLALLGDKLVKNDREQRLLSETIELTKLEITDKEKNIKQQEAALTYQKELLSNYLRELQYYDRTNKILLIFDSKNLSDFYRQLNFTQIMNDQALDSTQNIRATKENLELDREVLVNKRLEQESSLSTLKIYESECARAQEEYQIMKERNASEIQSLNDVMASTQEARDKLQQELFALTREGQSIKFGEAARYARGAAAKTGIRPALIMSIVKQETDFGINVGNGTYRADMNPDQWDDFVKVCLALGRSPENTPVSAKPKSYSGWGGAMGIAQFLPSTWLGIADEVANLTGHRPADPWNPTDAFVAVGVKMKGLGAVNNNHDAEWEAAGRYFAGANFQKFPWYADNVMQRAEIYEEQLKQIP